MRYSLILLLNIYPCFLNAEPTEKVAIEIDQEIKKSGFRPGQEAYIRAEGTGLKSIDAELIDSDGLRHNPVRETFQDSTGKSLQLKIGNPPLAEGVWRSLLVTVKLANGGVRIYNQNDPALAGLRFVPGGKIPQLSVDSSSMQVRVCKTEEGKRQISISLEGENFAASSRITTWTYPIVNGEVDERDTSIVDQVSAVKIDELGGEKQRLTFILNLDSKPPKLSGLVLFAEPNDLKYGRTKQIRLDVSKLQKVIDSFDFNNTPDCKVYRLKVGTKPADEHVLP